MLSKYLTLFYAYFFIIVYYFEKNISILDYIYKGNSDLRCLDIPC